LIKFSNIRVNVMNCPIAIYVRNSYGKKIKIDLYMAIQSGPKVVLVLESNNFFQKEFSKTQTCVKTQEEGDILE